MKVSEVMNVNPVVIGRDGTINEAAKLLVKYNLTALSVVDDTNKLEGIITEGDLLYKKIRPHAPRYVNVLGASIYYSGIGEYNEQFRKLLATHVAELMTVDVVTCRPDTDVEEIAGVMLEKHLKSLPVVDEAYHLQGVITRHDIMRLLAESDT